MNTGKNPYPGTTMPIKTTPETVTGQMAKAEGKAKARFPHKPLMPDQKNASAGSGGRRQAL